MTEQTLFHEALAKEPAQRAAFLNAACAGQTELRVAVEALLAAHGASASLLDEPAADPNRTGVYTPSPVESTGVHVPKDAQPGYVIAGRYTLEQKLGEGGMGEVWVAKQTEPVKRKVALKLIKAGMDSKAVLQRFDAERQALALMDHPHIAKVLDGGLTQDRYPFFVMELVNGLALNKFCDQAKLTPQQRLELFVPICQAVQHAHQKGIIHRDLKPANILVTLIDGRPVPKVIDFGVAKATGGKLTDESLLTQFGAVVGTLEYMAPEQAGYAGEDIDTRADIYSLGVILYELLTGLRPIDTKRFHKAALTEMIRIIKEEEPSKPSTRLSTDESLPSLASLRQIEPKKLMALLRGELDWVVMKCLEKQRDQRYETANGLARDIQRYLADEPVEARPPSFGYRAGKFLRRHTGPVIAAGLVFFTLLAGVAGMAWQAIRVEQARADEAEQRGIAEANVRKAIVATEEERKAKREAVDAAGKEKAARLEALKRLKQIEQGNAVLMSVFDDLDIRKVKAGKEPLEAVLAKRLVQAGKQLDGESVGDPLVVAELQNSLGFTLLNLGFALESIPLSMKALETRTAKLGADDPLTLDSMNNLAMGYKETGRLDKALPMMEETLKLRTAKLGTGHHGTLASMGNLASTYQDAGKLDKALPLLEETLKLMTAKLGANHPNTLLVMNNLATGYHDTGRLDKAILLLEEALARARTQLGGDHPFTLITIGSLANCYQDAGKLDLALPLYEETLKLIAAKQGADHPDTLVSMNNLADAYRTAGQFAKALPLLEKTLRLMTAKLGADHPSTLRSKINLALGYQDSGQVVKALPLLEEAFKLTTAKLGPDHPDTLQCMTDLAKCYQFLSQYAKALPLLEEALKLTTAKLGADHPHTLQCMASLAGCYWVAGKLDQALPLMEETLKLQSAKRGADHPETLVTMGNLASIYQDAGRLDKALPLMEATLNLQTAKLGADHPHTLVSMNNLALAYKAAGKLDRAIPLFEETLKLITTKLGADHPYTFQCMGNLAMAYWATKQLDKSIPLLERAVKGLEQQLGRQHPETLKTVTNLGVNYKDAGRLREAIPLLEEAHRSAEKYPQFRSAGQHLLVAYAKAGENVKMSALYPEQLPEIRKQLPKESSQLAGLLAQIGMGLLEQKKWTEAEPLIRECLAIREKTQPDAWQTFNTQSMLGGVLLGQKKFAEAETLLLAGYEGMKQREKSILPQGQIRIPEALDRLIELYTATHKPAEVKKWQAERAKYPPVVPPPGEKK